MLREKDLRPLVEHKIISSFFEDEEHRRAFRWMLSYWTEYHETPTVGAFRKNFPSYKLVKVEEPLQWYIDEMRARRKYGLVVETLQDASSALGNGHKDSDAALGALSVGLSRIGSEVSSLRDDNLPKGWRDRMRAYREVRDSPGMRGITTGFPTLDRTLSGFQKEQLVSLVGESKVGKSTIAMKMALAANEENSVLFIGFEMSNEEQSTRHDSMVGGVNYLKLLTGKLPVADMNRLARALKEREKYKDFVLSSDISSATTVSGVTAKIEQHSPNIVFIDGVYLMDDEEQAPKGSPQALTNITRSLKRMAQRQKIPVVITTQVLGWKVNRSRGITADSIGYTSSFAQDSDVVIGVEETIGPDGKTDQSFRKMRVVVARGAKKSELSVRWNWDDGEIEEADDKPMGYEDEDETIDSAT